MSWIGLPIYNPVVVRELRTRLRGWRPTILITVYMVLFAGISSAYLWQQSGLPIGQSSQMGLKLFIILASLQMGLTILITPSAAATAVSGERQRQTWELMLVTRLSPFRIAWGKLVSSLAFNVLLMFAVLPVFSFVFLFGGVDAAGVIRVYLVTLVTALFIGCMSILISAFTKRVVGSVIAANIAALVPTLGFTALSTYLLATQTMTYYGRGRAPRPRLTPLAQLDPLIAFTSALPSESGAYLHEYDQVHVLGFLGTLPMWEAFSIVTPVVSLALIWLAGRVAAWRGPKHE